MICHKTYKFFSNAYKMNKKHPKTLLNFFGCSVKGFKCSYLFQILIPTYLPLFDKISIQTLI